MAKTAYFVTLTYSDEFIPENGLLVKEHLQNFMKRVRRDNVLPMKYYAVGEYGEKSLRPHYHAIMFNVRDYNIITSKWDFGFIQIGQVNDASIHYVTKYVITHKSQDKSKMIPPSKIKGGNSFSLISKGLGKSYVDNNEKWHKSGLKSYVINNGYKQALPRYYADKMFNNDEKEMLKNENASRMQEKAFEHEELMLRLGTRDSIIENFASERQKIRKFNLLNKKGKL